MIGLGLGFLWGIIGGITPGVNYMFIYFWVAGTDASFALPFILSSSITGTIISKINYLTPISAASNPLILNPISELIKEGKGILAIRTSAFTEVIGLSIPLAIAAILIITDNIDWFDIPLVYQSAFFGLALLIWGYFIIKAEKKILASITLVIAAIMAYLVLHLGHYGVYSMSTALFSVGLGSLSLKQNTYLPPQLEEYPKETFEPLGLLIGFISGIGIGIPSQVLLSLTEEEEESKLKLIARDGIASGIVTGLSLVMVLFGFGSRDTASTIIGTLNIPNTNYYGLSVIILAFVIGYVSLDIILDPLIILYKGLLKLNFKVISYIVLAGNVASVILLNPSWVGVSLIITGICYQLLVKESGLNRGASMAALSFLPIIGLSGI